MQKIFEIGLGRTGTRSLATAASILGFKTIHGLGTRESDIDHEYKIGLQADFLNKVSRGRCNFQACGDHEYIGHIGAPFFQQLDKQYPGSKFIFTYRNESEWIASFKTDVVSDWTKAYLDEFDHGGLNYGILWRLLLYGSVQLTTGVLSAARLRHEMAVYSYFLKKDNCLWFALGSGWPALCEFLNKPMPDEPYPWIKKGRANVPLASA